MKQGRNLVFAGLQSCLVDGNIRCGQAQQQFYARSGAKPFHERTEVVAVAG